ncbi:MAG: hypothetical protein JXR37_04480 [Kiritimatiellae bacterium]|nr:hypothetical protein [Kiritimatiellia bacterium]
MKKNRWIDALAALRLPAQRISDAVYTYEGAQGEPRLLRWMLGGSSITGPIHRDTFDAAVGTGQFLYEKYVLTYLSKIGETFPRPRGLLSLSLKLNLLLVPVLPNESHIHKNKACVFGWKFDWRQLPALLNVTKRQIEGLGMGRVLDDAELVIDNQGVPWLEYAECRIEQSKNGEMVNGLIQEMYREIVGVIKCWVPLQDLSIPSVLPRA